MLLVDEVDRADDEFEAFLLEVLSTYQVLDPREPARCAATPAGRRADLQPHPRAAATRAPLPLPLDRAPRPRARGRDPRAGRRRCRRACAGQVVEVVQRLRDRDDPQKPPGVAETLDWARALQHLGSAEIDLAAASATLGALVKYREDAEWSGRP